MPTLLCHSALRSARPEPRAAQLRSSFPCVVTPVSALYVGAGGRRVLSEILLVCSVYGVRTSHEKNGSLVAFRKDKSDSSFQTVAYSTRGHVGHGGPFGKQVIGRHCESAPLLSTPRRPWTSDKPCRTAAGLTGSQQAVCRTGGTGV